MKKYQAMNCNTIDSCLASTSLIEGQATAMDLLVKIEQNVKEKTTKDVMRTVYQRLQTEGEKSPGRNQQDALTKVRVFRTWRV